jgi:hypothetical protein
VGNEGMNIVMNKSITKGEENVIAYSKTEVVEKEDNNT